MTALIASADGESAPHTSILIASSNAVLRLAVKSAVNGDLTDLAHVETPAALTTTDVTPDILVIDLAVANQFNIGSLEWARRRWPMITIVAVGAASESAVAGLLRAGADDAVEKSSSPEILLARLGAAARRARAANALFRRRLGDVVYDRGNRRIWVSGEEIDLTPNEAMLLDRLWTRAGEVVRYDSLHDFVWTDAAPSESSNRVEVYISYLRKKLQKSNEVVIETMRGAGYRLGRKPR